MFNFRLKEREDTIEKLQEELKDKKEEFVKLEKVLQQQKDKNNVSISYLYPNIWGNKQSEEFCE